MKASRFKDIVREEIKIALQEFDSLYFTPAGTYAITPPSEMHSFRFEDRETWETTAKQMGLTIKDRLDDKVALDMNDDVIGHWNKMLQYGTLNMILK
jgi:hypothetical protein